MVAESLPTTVHPAILIYLHGFNSSPQAVKAQLMLSYLQSRGLAAHYIRPWIPSKPAAALAYLDELIKAQGQSNVCLIGSSLGGYYAAHLAECYALRSVLVNPAVRPFELMQHHLGENRNDYSGESFNLSEEDMADLHSCYIERVTHPENILLMVQKGDEALDYRDAVAAYPACEMIVEEGGDHHFQNFESKLPKIIEFLHIGD